MVIDNSSSTQTHSEVALRIALLGGSFNPPHVGHMMNAYYILATQNVDRVWLMPVFRHPFAKKLEPFEHRVRMCKAAAVPFGGSIEVTAVEQEVDVPTGAKTIDVLEHLIAKHPEHVFSLAVGCDILPERLKWKSFDRIEKLVEIIVINRAGFPAAHSGPILPEISSSDIREKLARGEDVSAFVPREVLEYIRDCGLYGLQIRAR